MAPYKLIRNLFNIVIMGELSGSIASWGFNQGNHVRQFAMDIVNLTMKENGCFIWCYQGAGESSHQGQDLDLGHRVRIFFALVKIILSLLVFTQFKLFSLYFI